jgi:hypothetical protein
MLAFEQRVDELQKGWFDLGASMYRRFYMFEGPATGTPG